ncbi:MAG TPA: hypothetical protein VHF06_08830 [Pseudonocardiaceae bacterium]|nr:hypothetical protein [Pseudonocardiaceae bacterium]
MGVTASLNTTHLTVAAGAEVACEVIVHNVGDVVDQFAVDVVGAAQEWAEVEPATINLLPGGEAVARVVFRPPRTSDVLAGVVPFGIRVLSREDPHGSVVEEGDVDVEPFTAVAAEIVPAKARAARRTRYRLVVDNNGNHETAAEIVAIDPDDELHIVVDPPTLLTRPGTATVVRAKVAPHRRFLKGEPRTHQFQLVVLPDGEDPITTNAVLVQQQVLPPWLLPLSAVLLVVVAALIALWFTVLKPTVASIAQDASQQQVSQAASAARHASQAARQASQAASAAQAASGGAGGGSGGGSGGDAGAGRGAGGKTASGGAAGGPSSAARTPIDFRIAATADPVTNGSFQSFSFTAPKHQPLSISDLVLQNPRGDGGFLQLEIGGTVVLQEGLANFRDLDYHYVSALHVAPNQPVILAVNCTAPGTGATRCTPSVSFSGTLGP